MAQIFLFLRHEDNTFMAVSEQVKLISSLQQVGMDVTTQEA